ncbi:uncharacterized protein LOC128204299 [Mya arenaria]|uniref:uncharacterized protein LOC128204299 n=1 Tax=Mya arenaria TaxID=6604 RepID=UPI0022E81DC8|nr:uncharacterized protein LOC128204299 [Mya arenaria]
MDDKKSYKSSAFSALTKWTHKTQEEEMDIYDVPRLCKQHSLKILNQYCAFCEKPVCDKCKLITHARHLAEIKGYDALVRAARSRRARLRRLLKFKETEVTPSLKGLILQISESRSKLESEVDDATRKYRAYVERHRDKLYQMEEEWVDDVNRKASEYYKLMDEKVTFLKEQLFKSESSFAFVRNKLDTVNHAELLLIIGVLRSYLEFMHDTRWPKEEIQLMMSLKSVPDFGSIMFQTDASQNENCKVDFIREIKEHVVYARVYDTKLPIPKKVLEDETAKISLASASEMYVSFREYIVTYTLDSRRHGRASRNIRFTSIMSVSENILDISCDKSGHIFYITNKAVKSITDDSKILQCFTVPDVPSAVCVDDNGQRNLLYVAFHNAGRILKFTISGELLATLSHPDPRMMYRPRHLTTNMIGELFFSDDISNITILDDNGIWKRSIKRDVKTTITSGPLRPNGIACSPQRHVFVVDANAVSNLHIFGEDGKYQQTAVFKNLHDAYVVSIDVTGDVWIAFKDGRLRIYRPEFITDLET